MYIRNEKGRNKDAFMIFDNLEIRFYLLSLLTNVFPANNFITAKNKVVNIVFCRDTLDYLLKRRRFHNGYSKAMQKNQGKSIGLSKIPPELCFGDNDSHLDVNDANETV